MRRRLKTVLPICLLLAGCGVGQSPQTLVAHKIADALPQTLGHAAHYDVHVSGDSLGLARGRARLVQVDGQDVELTHDITLDALHLEARDIAFDTRTRRVKSIGSTSFVSTLGQEHLNSYLARTHPTLHVALGGSDLQITLPVAAGPVRTTVQVAGTLSPTSPGASTMDFTADKARLGRLPVPAFVVNAALTALNPVLDLSQERVPIGLTSANVEEGRLVLHGAARLDALEQ